MMRMLIVTAARRAKNPTRAAIAMFIAGTAMTPRPVSAQLVPPAVGLQLKVDHKIPAASCAAEGLSVAGRLGLIVERSPWPGGRQRSSVTVDVRGLTATGSKTGRLYRVENSGTARRDFACAPGDACLESLVTEFVLAGDGPDDGTMAALHVRFTSDASGALRGHVASGSFACRTRGGRK